MLIHDFTLHTEHGPLYGQTSQPEIPRATIMLARAHHAAADSALLAGFTERGYAVFAVDLLTSQENQFVDAAQNVPRLMQRLLLLLDFARRDDILASRPFAIYASGESSPAAIRAAAQRDTQILAVACHGGHIDRAGKQALNFLAAPLLVLGDAEEESCKASYDLARPHLATRHEFHPLGPAEDPLIPAALWFSRFLHS